MNNSSNNASFLDQAYAFWNKLLLPQKFFAASGLIAIAIGLIAGTLLFTKPVKVTQDLPKSQTWEPISSNTDENFLRVWEAQVLKTELENDLRHFDNVLSAKVAIDLPTDPELPSKSSIILNLVPGRQLSWQEQQAIAFHVVGAVRGLNLSHLAIADTTGRVYQPEAARAAEQTTSPLSALKEQAESAFPVAPIIETDAARKAAGFSWKYLFVAIGFILSVLLVKLSLSPAKKEIREEPDSDRSLLHANAEELAESLKDRSSRVNALFFLFLDPHKSYEVLTQYPIEHQEDILDQLEFFDELDPRQQQEIIGTVQSAFDGVEPKSGKTTADKIRQLKRAAELRQEFAHH